jgi:RimJ/RimL family protein N-acetyltransferase
MRRLPMPGCRLVPWNDTHDERTVRWLNDPAIRASFGITSPVSLESHRRWQASQAATVAWAIEVDGLHCGNLLLDLNRRHDSAYLQIYIGEPGKQGRGVGRAAMELALAQAFGHLGLHRVWLHTRPDNIWAQRLYQSLGFRHEGIERESVKADGVYLSQQRWSLLASEWKLT